MKPLLTCPARSWGFRPIQTPTLGVHSQPGDAALQPREGDGLWRWYAARGRGQPQLGGDRAHQVGERCFGNDNGMLGQLLQTGTRKGVYRVPP